LEWRIVFVIWLADGRFPSQTRARVPGGIVHVKPKELHEAFECEDALVQGRGTRDEDEPISRLTTPGGNPSSTSATRGSDFPHPSSLAPDSDAPTEHEIVIPGEEEERRLFLRRRHAR